jgi:hypothetical protein
VAGTKTFVVTTSGDRPLAEVRKDLTAKGFKVVRALDALGMFIGKATPATARKLRSVEGVTDVSQSAEVDIGPPDSPIQ